MPTIKPNHHIKGTVTWYNHETGTGEVHPDDGSAPCTINADGPLTCGIGSLEEGHRIQFLIDQSDGQRRALSITRLPEIQRWENEGGAVNTDPNA